MALGSILTLYSNRLIKLTLNFEGAIDNVFKKFNQGCPNEETLENILKQKQVLSKNLEEARKILTTLEKTTTTADIIVTTLSVLAKIIKTFPLPTSVPPGVGIPINVITNFSDVLDDIREVLNENNALIFQMSIVLREINNFISSSQLKLNSLDIRIKACRENLSNEELQIFLNDLNRDSLIDSRLSINSNDPLIYKGWRLTTQTRVRDNLTERRIVATNINNPDIILLRELYEDDDGWSFSDSIDILIEEIKFTIDQKS